ncbi:MAG: type II secretion system protein GspD [Candidatus Omnitrophica bacterium]|nr:type II secretion system protein GspD [Candidatus Omnitrophota bacterium]
MSKKIFYLIFCFGFFHSVCAQDVSDVSSLLSADGKMLYGNEPNSVLVIDYPENLKRVDEYLSMVDVSPQQVLIEARVVEVKLEGESALGINWSVNADKGGIDLGRFTMNSSSGGGLDNSIPYKNTYYPPGTTTSSEDPFTVTMFDKNINVVMEALANTFDTNILSAPSITTVNNREAEIKIIRSLPWAEPQADVSEMGTITVTWDIHFEEVGIELKVTPTITDDGQILMTLEPEVSEYVEDYELEVQQGTTTIPYTVPVIDKRNANTKVVIGDGKTLIIGGLIKDKVTKGETKIPLLGDIPGLGWLFKSKKDTTEKTELLIFVSPKIITPSVMDDMKIREERGVGKWYSDERKDKELALFADDRKNKEKLACKLTSLEKRLSKLVNKRKNFEERLLSKDSL